MLEMDLSSIYDDVVAGIYTLEAGYRVDIMRSETTF